MGPCGELHICPSCGSHLVQPQRWERTTKPGSWRLWRRCPECEWTGNRIHHEAEIDAYDEELDHGSYVLDDALTEMQLDALTEIAGPFGQALEEGLITADDFRTATPFIGRRYPASRYSLE